MNHTASPPLLTRPPALKQHLSTLVDNQPLDLGSRLGKRRLFKHRIWANPDSACPGWLQVRFWPGWMGNLPSGRVTYVRHEICKEGELPALIERLQAEHNVHLWHAPIQTPTTWPRGNFAWFANDHALALLGHKKLESVA